MAGPLTAVERFFERLFERPAARLFQEPVERVQIQRAIERTIESERAVHDRRAYVPAHYRVLLNTADAAALDGDLAKLTQDLADQVRLYARAHDYVLQARPFVEVIKSSAVASGDMRVYADRSPAPEKKPPTALPAPVQLAVAGDADAHEAADAEVDVVPGGTAVFAVPRPNSPRAQLAVRTSGQPVSRINLRPGTIRLGRALDNDIVLPDDKVSRHHGQIGMRLGMLVYTDLGSTNGSFLNGAAVTEIALGPGDVLQVGGSTITVEPAP
ncbi:MAG: FhaA domain-containing protein [Candidatus Limnocylindrales bacterium]